MEGDKMLIHMCKPETLAGIASYICKAGEDDLEPECIKAARKTMDAENFRIFLYKQLHEMNVHAIEQMYGDEVDIPVLPNEQTIKMAFRSIFLIDGYQLLKSMDYFLHQCRPDAMENAELCAHIYCRSLILGHKIATNTSEYLNASWS